MSFVCFFSVNVERPVLPTTIHVFGDNDRTMEINQDDKEISENINDLSPSPTVIQMFTSAVLTRCKEESFCLQHCVNLGVYCKTDQTLNCKHCASLEHQDHNKCYIKSARVRFVH